ncbi:hypothetical protein QQF64_032244 [Cirrhinus molitorella]|uniref:Uncharacterized protein n=1 Tax=Cirrhinus molitorella TaxID=172907 RepID=A0ABR3MZ85_9TELE
MATRSMWRQSLRADPGWSGHWAECAREDRIAGIKSWNLLKKAQFSLHGAERNPRASGYAEHPSLLLLFSLQDSC